MAQKDNNLYKFESNQEVKQIDTSKKVRIGIIGTGWIADSHADGYLKQPDVEIIALADLIPGKAEAFKKKWNLEGAKVYEGENAHLKMLEAEKDLGILTHAENDPAFCFSVFRVEMRS